MGACTSGTVSAIETELFAQPPSASDSARYRIVLLVVPSFNLPRRSAARMMVLARFLERRFASVGEVSLMSLEAFADVPMPSLGVLAKSICVSCAGHMHLRGLPSAFVRGWPGWPRLRIPDCRNGEDATEGHKPNELRDHVLM